MTDLALLTMMLVLLTITNTQTWQTVEGAGTASGAFAWMICAVLIGHRLYVIAGIAAP